MDWSKWTNFATHEQDFATHEQRTKTSTQYKLSNISRICENQNDKIWDVFSTFINMILFQVFQVISASEIQIYIGILLSFKVTFRNIYQICDIQSANSELIFPNRCERNQFQKTHNKSKQVISYLCWKQICISTLYLDLCMQPFTPSLRARTSKLLWATFGPHVGRIQAHDNISPCDSYVPCYLPPSELPRCRDW